MRDEGLTKGPYQIRWESCEHEYPCSCGQPWPYEIYAPNKRIKRYKGSVFEESAVIANLYEANDCTEADAHLLAASWDLLQYVKRRAESGDADAAKLVEYASGARCPHCHVYSKGGAECPECVKALEDIAKELEAEAEEAFWEGEGDGR